VSCCAVLRAAGGMQTKCCVFANAPQPLWVWLWLWCGSFSIGDWAPGALKTQTVKGSLVPVYDLTHKPLSFPLTINAMKHLREGKLALNVEGHSSSLPPSLPLPPRLLPACSLWPAA
jgi:hypothetical protein